jgi:hypothetical protein
MITMTDEPKRYTTARGEYMDLIHAKDKIEAKREDAIIHDQNRSFSETSSPVHSDAKGDYFEVYADGRVHDITDNAAAAEQSLREYRSKHPKQ